MPLTNRTCLHVSDLEKSIKFYADAFGFKQFSKTADSAVVGLDVAKSDLASRQGLLEFKKISPGQKIYNGNTEPYRGFGHLCISVGNIAAAQVSLLKQGVNFKKRLEDGRQKDIIFVLDPDQYWIELIENKIDKKDGVYDIAANRLNHTMIRVKDPKKSLEFYQGVLGMSLFSTRPFPSADFTVYFLGYDKDPAYVDNKEEKVFQAGRESIIELTHNYGTESDDSKYYVFGKQDPSVVGFDHFTVKTGKTQSLVDPDGYRVETF